jgi:hypothetical protein
MCVCVYVCMCVCVYVCVCMCVCVILGPISTIKCSEILDKTLGFEFTVLVVSKHSLIFGGTSRIWEESSFVNIWSTIYFWGKVRATRRFVNFPFGQQTIWPTGQFDNLSFCHRSCCQLTIWLTCHFVQWSFCQLAILITWHFDNLPFYQFVILSTLNLANISFGQQDNLITYFLVIGHLANWTMWPTRHSVHWSFW